MASESDPLLSPATRAAASRRQIKVLGSLLSIMMILHFIPVGSYIRRFVTPEIHSRRDGGIHWRPCPDNDRTFCSYLDVPMDYSNATSTRTMSLFLRKLPASVKANSDYMGPIIINPGGPGGSGNEAVLGFGADLHDLLDGRYDIIGFDSRGVNMTLPPIGCQSTPAQAAHLQEALQHLGIHFEARHSVGRNASSTLAIANENAFARKNDILHAAIARSCANNGNAKILEHIGTAAVARDMKQILEELGQLDQGLNYYGKSYGTVLGSTFAALFPEHVNRVVLDGVADATTYYRDFLEYGRAGMADTKKTAAGFYSSCAGAGPSRCALSIHANTTANDIEKRVDALYVSLAKDPLPVPISSAGTGILTASDLKLFFFVRMYAPSGWPSLARGIAEAEGGNGTFVFQSLYGYFVDAHKPSYTMNPFHKHMGSSFLSTIAIMCGDTTQKSLSRDDFLAYVHELEAMSPIGQNWAHWQSFCRFWDAKAHEIYDGPWQMGQDLRKTRFPLLYVSQTNDPVTPLATAQKMVRAFGNESATLLIQNGYGHCSHAHPSLCTAKHIRNYFLDGLLPPRNTICEVEDGYLFPHPNSNAGDAAVDLAAPNSEDKRMSRILHRLSKHVALN